MSEKLRLASMFAGIGGICLGFKQAGFDIVWANDNDSAACNTYRHNFGKDYLVESNIKKINPDNLPDFEVLAAGFPCQSFSIAGKQLGFKDPRGNLFFEVARIINGKRPRIVFLENVGNLVEHDDGKTFLVIYNSLVQFGYYVKYKVMDAQVYGNIPQRRNRIYIVAFKDYEDCNKFSFPEEVPLVTNIFDLIDRTEKHSDCYYYTKESRFYESLIEMVKDNSLVYRINDGGRCGKGKSVSQTLVASMGNFTDRVPIILDDFGIRRFTPQECLLLQGFPQGYVFSPSMTMKAAYTQAGNSVCVPVVRRIAASIAKIL